MRATYTPRPGSAAERAISHLRTLAQATVRFWSVEPMLGPLGEIPRDLLPDWVICGGESGPGARKVWRAWIDELREQCVAAGVPFFFKQWGGRNADAGGCELDGAEVKEWPHAA